MYLLYQGKPTAHDNFAARQVPREKNVDVYYVNLVGAAWDKNNNSFSVRGGKKVAHHCSISLLYVQ